MTTKSQSHSWYTKQRLNYERTVQIKGNFQITFAVCTVLLIAVHMLALMISTCILPNVEAVANLHYQTQKTVFESPHMKMNHIVELAWGFSTVIGTRLCMNTPRKVPD